MTQGQARPCAGPCGARGLALAGAVLVAHLALLAGGAPEPPPRPGPGPVAAVTVRLLPAGSLHGRAAGPPRPARAVPPAPWPVSPPRPRGAAPAAVIEAGPASPGLPSAEATRGQAPPGHAAAAAAMPVPGLAPADVTVPEPTPAIAMPAPAVPAAQPDPAGDPAAEPPAATALTQPPPVYPARLLPAAQWRFRLLPPSGAPVDAVLDWRPDGAHYQLRFDAAGPDGRPLVQQRSEGALGATGLAPGRFTDRRRSRGARALSIEAEAGRVRFSAVEASVPAWSATQDRLSWLLQLAAVVRAADADGRPLPEVLLHVVDARGGSALWRFVAAADEPVATPAGPRTARAWRHEPAQADGLRWEVWLDPEDGHRPLRLRQTVLRSGAVTEWLPAR